MRNLAVVHCKVNRDQHPELMVDAGLRTGTGARTTGHHTSFRSCPKGGAQLVYPAQAIGKVGQHAEKKAKS